MRTTLVLLAALSAAMTDSAGGPPGSPAPALSPAAGDTISLPNPRERGAKSLEEAIASRRSVREFLPGPLSIEQLSQLLWAAQGVTSATGQRAAPSAGALYPLEVYVATAAGVHRYEPARHRLVRLTRDDRRAALRGAALGQPSVGEAPAVFVIAAEPGRTEAKYGPTRTPRYVAMEAGHAAQNLLLEAVALGLAAVPVGAFDDARVKDVLRLPSHEEPLYLIPVGRPRTTR